MDLLKQLNDHVLQLGYSLPLLELKCPQCHQRLIERKNKKSGHKFWGCAGYPDCKYTTELWIGIKDLEAAYQHRINELVPDQVDPIYDEACVEQEIEWKEWNL